MHNSNTDRYLGQSHKRCYNSEKRKLLLKKSIYPYYYMDRFERFDEAGLPAKEEFFSKLGLS